MAPSSSPQPAATIIPFKQPGGVSILAAARKIAQIQRERRAVEARWGGALGDESNRLGANLDRLDDQEHALRNLIATTPPGSLHDATIQLALGLSETAVLHGGEGTIETADLLAAGFGYLARELGLDPETYGLSEYVGPYLTAATKAM